MSFDDIDGEVIVYVGDNGDPHLDVRFQGETVWLNQAQMTELFGRDQSVISRHIKKALEDGEITEESNMQNMHIAHSDKPVAYYDLDVIISVGYKVNSIAGVQFRRWATTRLREYIIKGFTMDDERLKGNGGGEYWKELLDRIRDIRSSEKALYRQVLDLYATSQDYNPKSPESMQFFKTVQNKLHYATNQQTAAELVHARADSKKDFMGLTTFAGALPTLKEAVVAKNFLTEDELFRLNRLVSAFFDLAEIKAQERTPMHMKDWVAELDKFSGIYGKGALLDAGSISHDRAVKKATDEYRKYQARTLSPVETAYLDSVKSLQKSAEKGAKQK